MCKIAFSCCDAKKNAKKLPLSQINTIPHLLASSFDHLYNLRKPHVPEVIPSTQSDRLPGDDVPTVASKRTRNIKKGAADRRYLTTLPLMARQIRKEVKQGAGGGREGRLAVSRPRKVTASKSAPFITD